jgi:hypothetical protein
MNRSGIRYKVYGIRVGIRCMMDGLRFMVYGMRKDNKSVSLYLKPYTLYRFFISFLLLKGFGDLFSQQFKVGIL